ncbi:testis-expressed protein 47 [Stegastes partitus]|uniref:Testis-expressed protein 47 n=1 Tax=Stegastes partitus TaxID=144197 RepID=A0A9Y4JSB8_9TELE|nr:PREDICTED: uncharacterized protein C7orf62 homolog [Stegastes partitus]
MAVSQDSGTMFEAIHGRMREKIVLQRLIVIARLPHDPADRTELGAHYENLKFQLNKQYIWDHITGLLLIYPSCLLHVVESSRDILISVLKDLTVMQQQPHCALMEAKIVFMAHDPESRLFHQWSYKVLDAGQAAGNTGVKELEEDENSTETLVCSVLSALQKLSEQLEITKKALPGSVLDETPELIVPLKVLDKLLGRDELLSPQQYLQMYNSPLHVSIEFGQINPRSFFPSV